MSVRKTRMAALEFPALLVLIHSRSREGNFFSSSYFSRMAFTVPTRPESGSVGPDASAIHFRGNMVTASESFGRAPCRQASRRLSPRDVLPQGILLLDGRAAFTKRRFICCTSSSVRDRSRAIPNKRRSAAGEGEKYQRFFIAVLSSARTVRAFPASSFGWDARQKISCRAEFTGTRGRDTTLRS